MLLSALSSVITHPGRMILHKILMQLIFIKFIFCYSGKQMLKMAKKTISEKITVKKKHGRHKKESEGTEEAAYLLDLSRCNSYDFESAAGKDIMVGAAAGSTAGHMMAAAGAGGGGGGGGLMRDTDTLYFRERHLVPVDTIRAGMGRFSFLLETCSPGSIPDPLMVSALLDLVSGILRTMRI